MDSPDSPPSDIDLQPSEALYFFALAGPSAGSEFPDSLEGFEGSPVRYIPCGEWTAVVDIVERSDWAGEDAEDNLQSIEWVGPRAVRHEDVIEAVMDAAPVFPARFGTLFSSADELVRRISPHRSALQAYFERVTGCREWTLRGHLDRETAQEALAGPGQDADGGGPGTAYLQKQKRVQDARDDLEDWLERVADRLDERLGAVSDETEVREPPPRSEEAGEPVLERALLVPRDQEDALHAILRTLNDGLSHRGLHLALKGPWPPYTFRPAEEDRPSTPT